MHEPGASPVGGVRSRRVVSTPNCITITSTRRCGDLERKEARIFQEHISCSVVISIDDERTARTAKHLGATECRVEAQCPQRVQVLEVYSSPTTTTVQRPPDREALSRRRCLNR